MTFKTPDLCDQFEADLGTCVHVVAPMFKRYGGRGTFSGRIVTGHEAVALGLATRVEAAPRDAALALAREIAQRSPSAIRAGKRLLNASVTAGLEEGMRLEERLQRELIGSPNQLEAVQANLEQRPPRFADPE